uniref:Uncharacterized protein n=1 Tax=Arundo donax TaxID=35708 RepID=A0A0A9CMQ6_ARUDO
MRTGMVPKSSISFPCPFLLIEAVYVPVNRILLVFYG